MLTLAVTVINHERGKYWLQMEQDTTDMKLHSLISLQHFNSLYLPVSFHS